MRAARALVRTVGTLAAVLLLSGALPGEMRGCATDLSDEVNHIEYCRDRCEVACGWVVECGVYVPTTEPDEGEEILDHCREECEATYSCDRPQLCTNPDRYISENEAQDCLDEWADMSCSVTELDPSWDPEACGTDLERCPRPTACRVSELCDPAEWE